MNNENKSAEELKSEALEEAFFQTFGCSSKDFIQQTEKALTEFINKEYPKAK